MLKIRNLESGYNKLRVLKSISVHVKPGEIVAIIGANGAGKSTLLKTIAGLIKVQSGTIDFKNKDITAMPVEKIVSLGCSLIPEGRQLFPTMTVRENIILGSYILLKKKQKDAAEKNLKEILSLFPRLKERESQLAGTLSGGEQQMVAIARSLMSDPDFIMMDEPSLGLAPLIVKDIFNVVKKLKEKGKTILLVEQNAKQALKIADRGYVLETGSLVMDGTSEELLNNHDVQRAYLGKDYNKITD
jgi:branched-chain amino acid transport system ATP-binding protein